MLMNFQGFAQLSSTSFEYFTQTVVHPYIVNPSSTDTSYLFKVSINNKRELGLLQNTRFYYLDGDLKINSNRKNSCHFIGIQSQIIKFGEYVNSNNVQLRYSWLAQLTKESMISAGISLGFLNFSFQTTQGGTGGSDYAPDGSVGIYYLWKATRIGVSSQRIFNPVLVPVNQSFYLRRSYNVDLSQKIRFSPKTSIELYSVLQTMNGSELKYSLGFMTTIGNVGMLGLNNYSQYKTSVNAGFKNLNFRAYHLMLMSSFSFYHNDINLPDNTLEIFLSIQK